MEDYDRNLTDAIRQGVECMNDNRFIVFNIGLCRCKAADGLHNIPQVTAAAMEAAGARVQNHLILRTSIGSRRFIVRKNFMNQRVMTRTHEDIFVACKGDRNEAAKAMEDSFVLPWEDEGADDEG